MMTTEELQERLEKIDTRLLLTVDDDGTLINVWWFDAPIGDSEIYDFFEQKYDEKNCLTYIPDKFPKLHKLLDEYYEGREEILARDSEDSVDSTDPDSPVFNDKEHVFKSADPNSYVDTETAINDAINPFLNYTNRLAQTLLEKNRAYGDSFSQSVDDYGLKVIGIRLSDKYNRIKHLVNANSLKENDESLEDTLLDTAGYAILALKYLKEHKNENQDD